MWKSHKRLITSIAAIVCLLILMLAVGGTIAYMTDSESVNNTVTVGNVRIALREPDFPGNGNPGTVDLVPMETVPKNPQVKNVGTNDSIVFLKVEIPKAYVTLETETGFEPQQYRELFSMLNLDTETTGGWLQLQKDDTDEEKCVYVFAYKNKLASKDTTSALFDQVQFNNVIEQEVDRTTQNIRINAYAIQADNIPDMDSSVLTQDNLAQIYDIYMNQSGDKANREMSDTYKLFFNAEGGVVDVTEYDRKTGETYGPLPEPSKTGYTFDGWYTKNGELASDSDIMKCADVEVFAKWTVCEYINTTTFWAWGLEEEEGNNRPKTAIQLAPQRKVGFKTAYGTPFSFTLDMADGVKIPKGYKISQFGSATILENADIWDRYNFINNDGNPMTFTQPSHVVNAEFEYDVISYDITYNLNGGINNEENPTRYTILYGVTFKDPVKEGYKFDGWYIGDTKVTGINENCVNDFKGIADETEASKKFYAALETRSIGDVTVTAHWK